MSVLGIVVALIIVARYLQESGEPGAERVGRKLEEDLTELGDAVGTGCSYVWIGFWLILLLLMVILGILNWLTEHW